MQKKALAIGAHPDDVEFFMAGTLLLLKAAGFEIHMLAIANGSCGTMEHDAETIAAIRGAEHKAAAAVAGATCHDSLVNDIEIIYGKELLQRVTSVVRKVGPDIVLTHSPQDYMEDHMNASRLAVSGTFCRGLKNFPVIPHADPVFHDVAVYHAQPHLHRDPLGRRVWPEFYVDIGNVIDVKVDMLLEHKSQKEWLDETQGMEIYQNTLKDLSMEVGNMSGRFTYAEGWRRHLYVGLAARDWDPITEILAEDKILKNPDYHRD